MQLLHGFQNQKTWFISEVLVACSEVSISHKAVLSEVQNKQLKN